MHNKLLPEGGSLHGCESAVQWLQPKNGPLYGLLPSLYLEHSERGVRVLAVILSSLSIIMPAYDCEI